MESIHCKRLLYPVLMGSFHSEGTMTLPCFDTLFLRAPHLVACKWHRTRTSLLPSTFYRVSYEFICWRAQLWKVQAKGVLWLPRVSWGSTSVSDGISQPLSALRGASCTGEFHISRGRATFPGFNTAQKSLLHTHTRCALHSGLLQLPRCGAWSRWFPAVRASAWSIPLTFFQSTDLLGGVNLSKTVVWDRLHVAVATEARWLGRCSIF